MLADDPDAIFVATPGTVFSLTGDHQLVVREGEITIVAGTRPITVITAMGRVVAERNSAINVAQSRFGPVQIAVLYGTQNQFICQNAGRDSKSTLADNYEHTFAPSTIAASGVSDFAISGDAQAGPAPGMSVYRTPLKGGDARRNDYFARLARCQVCGVPQRVRNRLDQIVAHSGISQSQLAQLAQLNDDDDDSESPSSATVASANNSPKVNQVTPTSERGATTSDTAPSLSANVTQNSQIPPKQLSHSLPKNAADETAQLRLEGLFQEVRSFGKLDSAINGELTRRIPLTLKVANSQQREWILCTEVTGTYYLTDDDSVIAGTSGTVFSAASERSLALNHGELVLLVGSKELRISTALGELIIPANAVLYVSQTPFGVLKVAVENKSTATLELKCNERTATMTLASGKEYTFVTDDLARSSGSQFGALSALPVPGLRHSIVSISEGDFRYRHDFVRILNRTGGAVLTSWQRTKINKILSLHKDTPTGPALPGNSNSGIALSFFPFDSILHIGANTGFSGVSGAIDSRTKQPSPDNSTPLSSVGINPFTFVAPNLPPCQIAIELKANHWDQFLIKSDTRQVFTLGYAGDAMLITEPGASLSQSGNDLTLRGGSATVITCKQQVIVRTAFGPISVPAESVVCISSPRQRTLELFALSGSSPQILIGSKSKHISVAVGSSCRFAPTAVATNGASDYSKSARFVDTGLPGIGMQQQSLNESSTSSARRNFAECLAFLGGVTLESDAKKRISSLVATHGTESAPSPASTERSNSTYAATHGFMAFAGLQNGESTSTNRLRLLPSNTVSALMTSSSAKRSNHGKANATVQDFNWIPSRISVALQQRNTAGITAATRSDDNGLILLNNDSTPGRTILCTDSRRPYLLGDQSGSLLQASQGATFQVAGVGKLRLKSGTLIVLAGDSPLTVETAAAVVSCEAGSAVVISSNHGSSIKVDNLIGKSTVSPTTNGAPRLLSERRSCIVNYSSVSPANRQSLSINVTVTSVVERILPSSQATLYCYTVSGAGYYSLPGAVRSRIERLTSLTTQDHGLQALDETALGFAPFNALHYLEMPQTIALTLSRAGWASPLKQSYPPKLLSDLANLKAVITGGAAPVLFGDGEGSQSGGIQNFATNSALADPPLMIWVVAKDDDHPYVLEADRECVLTADKGTIFALSDDHELTLKNGSLKVLAGHFPINIKTGLGSVTVQPRNFAFVRQTTFGSVSVFSTKPSDLTLKIADLARPANAGRNGISATAVAYAPVGYSELRVASVTVPIALATGNIGLNNRNAARTAEAISTGALQTESTALGRPDREMFNQFPSSSEKNDAVQTFSASGIIMRYLANTRIDADRLGNLELVSGEVLADSSKNTSIKVGGWVVSLQKGSVALIKWHDGVLTVRDIIDGGANSVTVTKGTSTMALTPGNEVICGNRASDTMHRDGVARRHTRAHQYTANMEVTHSEFSLVSLSVNDRLLSAVLASHGGEERVLKERVVKMAACLTQVTGSHGAYKPSGSLARTK